MNQIFEVLLGREVASPASEINAGDDGLFVSGFDELIHLGDGGVERQRTALATHKRDHAEAATVVAAVLNFEIRPRPNIATIWSIKDRSGEKFGVREDVADILRAADGRQRHE